MESQDSSHLEAAASPKTAHPTPDSYTVNHGPAKARTLTSHCQLQFLPLSGASWGFPKMAREAPTQPLPVPAL